MIRVLLADDNDAVRSALADIIACDPHMVVVAQAADANEAIELGISTVPDVALLDVKMPGGGGMRAAKGISAGSPKTHIVALSAYSDRSTVLEMVRCGAIGYLVKGASPEEITNAVALAAEGRGTVSNIVAADVLAELAMHLDRNESQQRSHTLKAERVTRALAGGFRPVYQPIAELNDGRVVGVEALSRFDLEPRQGPDIWFREAAEVGLGEDLELAAVDRIFGLVPGLSEHMFVSINVSPATLLSDNFWKRLRVGPDPKRLVIEVTEHAPVDDYAALHGCIDPFIAAGGRLAVDDAGSGFASLTHILRLAPQFIKLDIRLTRGIDTNSSAQALAAGLASFADKTGAMLIAEGIETEAELEALHHLGIRLGQGYLLARPADLPAPLYVRSVQGSG